VATLLIREILLYAQSAVKASTSVAAQEQTLALVSRALVMTTAIQTTTTLAAVAPTMAWPQHARRVLPAQLSDVVDSMGVDAMDSIAPLSTPM